MKFAIIGTGYIFRTHLKAINEIGGKIVDAVNESHGEEAWREVVKHTDADCIVVLTPNDLHFEMTKFSAEQGKIILCEKPLVLKPEDAEVLGGYKDIFNVLQLRHHPLVEEIKKKHLEKNIKHQIQMNIFFKRDDENYIQGWKNNKERSGGFLFNLGIHYFDLLLYLFGEVQKQKLKEK